MLRLIIRIFRFLLGAILFGLAMISLFFVEIEGWLEEVIRANYFNK
jgi:hypothetical protein